MFDHFLSQQWTNTRISAGRLSLFLIIINLMFYHRFLLDINNQDKLTQDTVDLICGGRRPSEFSILFRWPIALISKTCKRRRNNIKKQDRSSYLLKTPIMEIEVFYGFGLIMIFCKSSFFLALTLHALHGTERVKRPKT